MPRVPMLWVFLAVAAIGLFWCGYRHPYRRRWLLPRRAMAQVATSAVDRQHRHLLAGGLVGETAIATTAAHFEVLLRAGRSTEVERELQPGVEFAVQVRALTAIGSPEAGRVLERQLARRLSRDPVEQTWYWADVVTGLRHLHHLPALPAVLRCADAAAGLPAGTVLAAEAVAFPNFPTALNDLTSPVGRAALRAVVAVSNGCREGVVDPGCMLRAGLGDALATLAETAPDLADPWLAAAILEAERVARRVRHWARLLAEDDRPLAEYLGNRLHGSASRRARWLSSAPARLLSRFSVARADEQLAILRFVATFRSDVTHLFPHLPDTRTVWWADAIRCLTWSKAPIAGPLLAVQALRALQSRRSRSRAPALLAALRGHACAEAEQALLRAIESTCESARAAAAGSLGWWPPFDPAAVMGSLRKLRLHAIEPTRRMALSALARLGERAALGEIAAGLAAEEPAIRAATAARIADEELSWLWPELQELAETGDQHTALACAEAVERLRERVVGPLG